MKTVIDLVTALKTYFTGKDTAAKQAVEANIAPVETDASSSAAPYSVGDQLILNDILYDVTASISISDALVVGTNIAAASDLSKQIGGKQDQIEVTSMPTASASNVGQVLIYIGATTSTYTSGQSYQSTYEGGAYIWKPAPKAKAVSYDGTQSGSSETDVQGAIDDLYSQNQTLTSAFVNNVNVNGSKNLLVLTSYEIGEKVTLNSGNITANEDGTYTIDGTFTASTSYKIDWLASKDRRRIDTTGLAGKEVTISCKGYSNSEIKLFTGCFKTDGTASQSGDYGYANIEANWTMPDDAYTFRNWISIDAGTYSNVTIYPMVRLATDNSSFVAPAKTNRQLTQDSVTWDDLSEVGAVNYIYPIDSTKTDPAGVTWTLNSDNSISVSSGGVAPSTGTGFSYRNNNAAFLRGKTVTFKANVTGNTPTYDKLYFAVICRETEMGANLVRYDLWPIVGQTEVTFTIPNNTNYLLIGCNIQNGATTAIDCKISPIVSLASYNGDYVPYAKSNKELTDDVANIDTQMSYINPVSATMNIYMTSDALPTWGSLTNQDATDIAQAMYDLYKKMGGKPLVRFGKLSHIWRKKSDGTQLASGNGTVEIINAIATYESCLSDNSKTRMRISIKDYGYCMTTDYALWGSNFTYLRRGTDTDGTTVDYHQKETIGTISTYVG